MSEVIAFWIVITMTGVLAALAVVIGSVRLKLGKHFTAWDMLLLIGLLLVMPLGGFAGMLSEDPGFYNRQVGAADAVTVQHLTYLNGGFGFSQWVRVDTDQGIYFISAYASVPAKGTIYRVSRERPWGSRPWIFLCASESRQDCWPTRNPDP